MRMELMMQTPNGQTFTVPLSTGLMDNPYNLLGICKKRQEQYGPGYKFWIQPAQGLTLSRQELRVITKKIINKNFFVDYPCSFPYNTRHIQSNET